MSLTRRSLLGTGAAMGGVALLAACGTAATTGAPKEDMAEAPKAEEKTEMMEKPVLKISNYHAEEDPRWKALSQTFATAEESLNITIEATPDRTFDGGVFAKRNTEFAAGEAGVDITYNQVNWALKWGLTGVIEELTPYFAKGPRSKEDYFAGELVNWSWGPNLYGVPFQSGGEVFHVNKDLLTQAGVDMPPPDWSYDDLLEMSRKLTNADENRWALVIYQNYVFYMMGTWMYNFGGQILNETKDKAVYGTDPLSLEGAQFNIDLALKHKVIAPGASEIGVEFPKGTYHIENQFAAMENNGIYRHNGIRPHLGEALDFLPPPKGLDQRVTVLGNAYSILSLSEAKDLAWDFLMWFHSDESMLETPHFGSIAWPPVIEYATHPVWLEPFKGTRVTDVVDVWISGGHDAMIVPEGTEAWGIDIEWTRKAISGEVTVPEAFRSSAEEMNVLFSQRPEEWKMQM
ncbi:MAG: substrate-binding domain-containing protein [Chloroflexota bacterium]|nr:substrate-binding domain-containing protein [Chloroflexota bacterium]